MLLLWVVGLPEASSLEEVLTEGLDTGLGHLIVRCGHQLRAQHLACEILNKLMDSTTTKTTWRCRKGTSVPSSRKTDYFAAGKFDISQPSLSNHCPLTPHRKKAKPPAKLTVYSL
jgi:hypothetical protein